MSCGKLGVHYAVGDALHYGLKVRALNRVNAWPMREGHIRIRAWTQPEVFLAPRISKVEAETFVENVYNLGGFVCMYRRNDASLIINAHCRARPAVGRYGDATHTVGEG